MYLFERFPFNKIVNDEIEFGECFVPPEDHELIATSDFDVHEFDACCWLILCAFLWIFSFLTAAFINV